GRRRPSAGRETSVPPESRGSTWWAHSSLRPGGRRCSWHEACEPYQTRRRGRKAKRPPEGATTGSDTSDRAKDGIPAGHAPHGEGIDHHASHLECSRAFRNRGLGGLEGRGG